jgi:hypothetical protein
MILESRERRFIVSGIDEAGDVYSYATNNLASAEATRKHWSEDLNEVTLHDQEAGAEPL